MKIARYQLDTKDWGTILLLRPIPYNQDPWGDLAPLRNTAWGKQIPVINGQALSHALHGFLPPLMQVLGPHPHLLCRRVPFWCDLRGRDCLLATDKCKPGAAMPHCYVPSGVPPEAILPVATVAQAWAEGRYVIIVEGDEFSL